MNDETKKAKEFAKTITKLLRKNGVSAGVIRGNGSTSPVGSDKYEAHFSWEQADYTNSKLYLNFKMDDGTSAKIKTILDDNEVIHFWDGGEASCFTFVKYNLRVCDKCKSHTALDIFVNNICKTCLDKLRAKEDKKKGVN